MMWYWGSGYGWEIWLGMLMTLVVWGGIITIIVFFVRALSERKPSGR